MRMTTTPELNLLTEIDTSRHISNERIIIFIGNLHAELGEIKTGCKSLFVSNFEEAAHTMKQLMHSFRKQPSLIIYKADNNYEASLAAWQQYFKGHPISRVVPFFLYTDQISDSLKACIRKYSFVDEIITKDCFCNQLHQKISFVNKYKKLVALSPVLAVEKTPVDRKQQVNTILKRTFDIVVAGCLLVLISPFLLIIAAIVKLESKGAVFYAARRAGKNYQVFKFYKFRTMVANADKQLQQLTHLNQYDANGGAVFYKVSNDPRVTRFGSFLRNTSLDEIPQLFNVLIGDMSLVGNRPLPLYEATALTTDDWAQRFLAPAGITGLWQISKRGKKEMSAAERIELDINYSQKHTFSYDMWIMMNTPMALVQKDNV
ncbi:lipopolysaccharide/colanic/teichoic acid biosynthesis glycosyltransferase [Chitinophaga niastensis]|uniref:Lipopolysaccharide/colanic/teichoic acid biosynthesis glycosyltransferase n=1 Tax=Chitinophaga niastensis TaxID=536980 RepID=A0A2P8HC37_CHINA|nr:sugar transferase [Chitinophaga niastensis]PSL43742.1 lipopolysaccharide/colanic/teichoic acid biosynthesis glycosyltransferase [Chitinophaga niastensis]